MSRSALLLCLLAAACGAAQPSRRRGLRSDDDGHRIVGGEPVEISQFPWQVSLEKTKNGRFRQFCGGSIIGSTWVMTAAHCLRCKTPQDVYVRTGSSFRETGGIVYEVANLIRHEYYDDFCEDYDIALLEISEPISFGRRAQAVMLGSSEVVGCTKVNVSGWGRTSLSGSQPQQLHAVTTTIVDRDICGNINGYIYRLTERMICASVPEGGKSACIGDSGGAVVVGYTQYGIASWFIHDCGARGYPEVYSNVPAFRSWITEKTGI